MRVVTLIAVIVALLGVSLRAEVHGGYTAEWLSHDALIIAVVTPVAADVTKGPGEVWFTHVRFRIDDSLKGPLVAGDTFTVHDFSYGSPDPLKLKDAVTGERKLVVYASPAVHMFDEIEGKLIFTLNHALRSAYYLDADVIELFTPDFYILSDPKELVRRTREQVAHERQLIRSDWRGSIQKKFLQIPDQSEAFKSLWRGSSCFLYVPDYIPK